MLICFSNLAESQGCVVHVLGVGEQFTGDHKSSSNRHFLPQVEAMGRSDE
jgi:hypothetical protein